MSRSPFTRAATATGLTFVTVSAGLLLAPSASAATELPAPVVTPGVIKAGTTITISGTACTNPEPDPAVEAWAGVGYGESGDGDFVEPNEDGTWSIQVTLPAELPAGTYPVGAGCDLYHGDTLFYADTTITVSATTSTPSSTPTATSTATSSAAPKPSATAVVTTDAKGVLTVTASAGQSLTPTTPAKVGERRILRLTGYVPGEKVTVVLHSTPRTIGTYTADASGTVVVDFVAPAGTAGGDHQLKVTRADGSVVSYPIRIAAAAAGSGSELAYTGADVALPLGLGAGALALGGGLVVAARRRSTGASQA